MTSSNESVDLEAQTSDVPQPQPSIDEDSPPMNIPNHQPPTSTDIQPQVTNTNQHHNGNPPAPKTADNLAVQRGMLTFPFYNL